MLAPFQPGGLICRCRIVFPFCRVFVRIWCLGVCVFSQFLCPFSRDGHIRCFYILGCRRSCCSERGRECRECAWVFEIVFSFSSEEYPQVELLAQMVVLLRLFFLMWAIFKVFTEFVTTLFLWYALAVLVFVLAKLHMGS